MFEETIALFRQGGFTLDVPKLEFHRCGTDSNDDLTGPGTIRQDADGQIEIKCHVTFANGQDMIDLLNRKMASASGSLYADDEYFDIQAMDPNADVWDAGKSLIHESLSFPMQAGTIIAKPQMLRRTQERKNGTPALQLYFFYQSHRDWEALIGGPYNIMMGALSFSLTVEADQDQQVKITAAAENPFPDAFERRLVEGLQFVVGQSLTCSIVDETSATSRTVSLCAAASHLRRVHSYPPLEIHTTHSARDVIRLLGVYMTYLDSLPDDGLWSPPTSFLSLLRGASESSLDGWLIGLCVAVEGLAGLIDYEPAGLSEELIRVQNGISDWLEAERVSDTSRKRIEGLLGQLGNVRPRDRMMSLVPGGALLEDDISAWTKARNRAVHTRKVKKGDLEKDKLQTSLDGLHRIYRLLYWIIFHVIGYSGKYTDYAEPGFPVKSYPSVTAAAE
ncbi:hypothetical protein [Sphingobium chungbukense]|uniref:ApeA N-terminal domain-containing protein n=1 Tax=Sphingobium chungbukense TaxID=56193 RepID=A0A0M3AMK9_9SPHN|nr:hypothetical protein [Sphingobium chungbukense]KKW90176.1 hypothetical protein YP76_22365 [Sphingobium chungbukense]